MRPIASLNRFQAAAMLLGAATSIVSCTSKNDALERQNELLRRELDELKAGVAGQNEGHSLTGASGFIEVRPPHMSSKEFIEWHRNYQDQERIKTGGGYSDYLIMKYKTLAERHQDDPAYLYIHTRMMPEADQITAGNNLVERFPDFAYGYSLAANSALTQDRPDYEGALALARKGLELDSSLPIKDRLPLIQLAVENERKAKALPIQIARSEPAYFETTIEKRSSLFGNDDSWHIRVERHSTSYEMTVRWEYLGPARTRHDTLGFKYAMSVSGRRPDSFYLRGTVVGSTNSMNILIDDKDLVAGKDRFTVFLSVEEVRDAQKIVFDLM